MLGGPSGTPYDLQMRHAFIPPIADQIGDMLPALWRIRSIAVRSTDYRLFDLADLDERIEANLDALRTMGPDAQKRCEKTLSLDSAGEVFVATLFALERHDEARIHNL